jgi:hypothetical protein
LQEGFEEPKESGYVANEDKDESDVEGSNADLPPETDDSDSDYVE